ncbi:MAG: FecR domain-containing protein [Pseudomonadota bacterium]
MKIFAPALQSLLLASSLLFALPVGAAEPVARVTHLSGLVTAKGVSGATRTLSVRSDIMEGDTLTTHKETYARLKFMDDAEVVLRPESQLVVTKYAYDAEKPQGDNAALSMLKGGLRAVSGLIGKRNKEAVSYTTPTATIGIRGTHFGALFCNNDCGGVPTVSGKPPANGLHVDVADGAIFVRNSGGSQSFNSGQFGFVSSPTAPPILVPPQQGVQVTMPPAISQNQGDGKGVAVSKDNQCVAQ